MCDKAKKLYHMGTLLSGFISKLRSRLDQPNCSSTQPCIKPFIAMETSQQNTQIEKFPCYYLNPNHPNYINGSTTLHQQGCPECVKWLFENNIKKFDHVLNKALSRESCKNKHIIKFALQQKYISDICDTEKAEHPEFLYIKSSCKAIKFPLEIEKIPLGSGVYFVVINNKSSEKVVYVGSSLSIRSRLCSHHVSEIQSLIDWGVELLIYCLIFPLEGTEQVMRETETYFIRELKPALNKRF